IETTSPSDESTYTTHSIELQVTTDDDGKFMFGHVQPGVYALGCSYNACYTAFRKTKRPVTAPDPSKKHTLSSEEPSLQISVNACEGLMCRVAVGKMLPDDWTKPSSKITITKDWSNTSEWLKSGGGVTLRID